MPGIFGNVAGGGSPILMAILGVVGFFIFIGVLKLIIKVTLPDNLLVVTGRKRKRNGKVFGFSV